LPLPLRFRALASPARAAARSPAVRNGNPAAARPASRRVNLAALRLATYELRDLPEPFFFAVFFAAFFAMWSASVTGRDIAVPHTSGESTQPIGA